MIATRRTFLGGLIAAVAATALPTSAGLTPTASAAPAPQPGETASPALRMRHLGIWTPLGPDARITRLYAPTSGALFAATDARLFRSDDAGASWRPVTLPASRQQRRAFEIDPTDHRVIYADSDDGLQRSDDEGVSWTTIMASTRPVSRIVASPADPRNLYLAQSAPMSGDLWFHRSFDGGRSWELVEEHHNSMCGWGFRIFYAHPTEPTRVFRTAGCYAGRDLNDVLEESHDSASTYQTILSPRSAFPEGLVGGGGSDPTRYYAVLNSDQRNGGGSSVQTSADDGTTWTPILEHPPVRGGNGSAGPNTVITGLAYDPAMPGRVFAAQALRTVTPSPWESGGINTTDDGGTSWSSSGEGDMPYASHLVLGIDSLNLFAATSSGVWRLALG